jgi:hypothetical protein
VGGVEVRVLSVETDETPLPGAPSSLWDVYITGAARNGAMAAIQLRTIDFEVAYQPPNDPMVRNLPNPWRTSASPVGYAPFILEPGQSIEVRGQANLPSLSEPTLTGDVLSYYDWADPALQGVCPLV